MSVDDTIWGEYLNDLREAIESDDIREDIVFNAFALRLFRMQQEFGSLGRLPGDVAQAQPAHWSEIPLLPQTVFKHAKLIPMETFVPKACFKTSGTTNTRKGEHFIYDMDWYRYVSVRGMRDSLYPNQGSGDVSILALLPSVREAPHSSLSTMLSYAMDDHGRGEHLWGITSGELRVSDCLKWLEKQHNGQPVLIAGTAFSWVHLLDAMKAKNLSVSLPAGSRLMETGGFKGRSRELPPELLHQLMEEHLDVPSTRVINEYGMTELMSQLYTCVGQTTAERAWVAPPWMRLRVVDPTTGKDAPLGQFGAIGFIDLANLTSSVSLQTQDVGLLTADGNLVLRGRANTASPRGCSLVMESNMPNVSIPNEAGADGISQALFFMEESDERVQKLWGLTYEELCSRISLILEGVRNHLESPQCTVRSQMASELEITEDLLVEGVRTGIEFWTAESFLDVIKDELDKNAEDRVQGTGSEAVLVIAASTVPTAMLFDVFCAWLVGRSVVVRVPDTMYVFAHWFQELLEREFPELADCLFLAHWPSADATVLKGLADRASCVVVNGSDETLERVREVTPGSQGFIGRGTRQSVALVDMETLRNEPHWREMQDGLARDILLWRQLGCLSPTCLFLEAGAVPHTSLRGFLTGLDEAITTFSDRHGGRTFSLDAAVGWMEHRCRGTYKSPTALSGQGFQNLVVEDWEGECIPVVQGGRLVVFLLDDLTRLDALERGVPLSTVVVPRTLLGNAFIEEFARRRGASRVVSAGLAQAPRVQWKHDGYDVLLPLR